MSEPDLYTKETRAIKTLSGMIAGSQEDVADAIHIGIDAIREKQERDWPRPLTREELEDMPTEPAYIYSPTAQCGCWHMIGFSSPNDISVDYGQFRFPWYLMGKTWIAYRNKPKICPNCNAHLFIGEGDKLPPQVCSACGESII